MLFTQPVQIYRKINNKWTFIQQGIGEIQGDNRPVGADQYMENAGLFGQAWIGFPEYQGATRTDIRAYDKVVSMDSHQEYFMSQVEPPAGLRLRHFEGIGKQNSFKDPQRTLTAHILAVNEERSEYDSTFDEYSKKVTKKTKVTVIILNIETTNLRELAGGKEPHNMTTICVERGDIDELDIIELKGKRFRVAKIVQTAFNVDIIELLESSR
jgi:hypothetical protein